ncbi:carboxymuconolactone decarboxylase family protein [Caulobacter sp. SSI4214]|uniref:carboxymuconolactone decarboxylase family protein n=1 Tax=Caulobacter sp. SSI4214 TaxID=2575739 RepID=UPI00143AD5AC|nr:carboxymuconolactone decarboxylase family protein [Caulobacter sp. SSI4214]
MRALIATLLSLALTPPALAQAGPTAGCSMPQAPILSLDEVASVSPALARYTTGPLLGELWKRPDLSPRDRSLATVAALIARGQTIEMPYHFNLALDNGVTPAELSETITHLAFYAGWANAMSAVAVAKDVFAARGITAQQLPAAEPKLLPLEPVAEAKRAASVQETVGPVSQGLVDYTGELLFHDLWLRPDLAPRDRSLVTVAALIASGQVAQVPFHLNRAMDNGLTRAQAAELLPQLAFYAGWPNVMSAVPVMKGVFDARPR